MDQIIPVRKGNEINIDILEPYLKKHLHPDLSIHEIRQFSGGYSNLTYLITTNAGSLVLRKPPKGVQIKTAHDMKREFQILSKLQGHFSKVPKPLFLCEDENIIGSHFYLMEKVDGIVLRVESVSELSPKPEDFSTLSRNFTEQLALLHAIDIYNTDLVDLGKPEGYVQRQVEGWIGRYKRAATDELQEMEILGKWMLDHMPGQFKTTFIHNDYKYDNLILNPECISDIKTIVDWEMATVGDPWMDLGTSLAYWTEEGDPEIFKTFNTTWLPGNFKRKEVVELYEELTGIKIPGITFYAIYGLYKVAVIAQQIYARYKKGMTNDPRFGGLIWIVKGASKRGLLTLEKDKI